MIKYIFNRVKKYSSFYMHMFATCIAMGIVGIVIPIISSKIIGSIIDKNYTYMVELITHLIISLSILVPMYFIRNYCRVLNIKRLTTDIQGQLINKINKRNDLSLVDFKYCQSLISQSIPKLGSEIINLMETLTGVAVLIILGVWYSIINNILVLIVTLIVTAIIFIINRKNLGRVQADSNCFEDSRNNLNRKIWDHIDNHEISTFLVEEKTLEGYDRMTEEYMGHLLSLKKSSNSVEMFSMFGTTTLVSIIILVGGFLNYFGLMEYAQIYAFALVLPQVSSSLFGLPEIKNTFNIVQGLWDMVSKFLTYDTENDGEIAFNGCVDTIAVKHLSYAYPNTDINILNDVSLTIQKGEFVGIQGDSGCGKSTLIKLIARLIPNDNNIFINNTPLSAINAHDYFKNISYLKQDTFVMNTTIEENITLGKPSMLSIEKAIELADLTQLIESLSTGIKSDIVNLSSGEKQKICFARTFYADKQVIILDEATSAMDESSEKHILNSLQQLNKEGKTIIAIAHRDSFLERCSRRIYLAKSFVREEVGLI